MRFPFLTDNMTGVLFHDLGNVYSNINTISFRYKQRDLTDFNYMVHAAGVGVRFHLGTTVAAVRADDGGAEVSTTGGPEAGVFRGGVACSTLPLPVLQVLLGHSQLATTQRYLHLSRDDDPIRRAAKAQAEAIAEALDGTTKAAK
jgi:hypothetical protein